MQVALVDFLLYIDKYLEATCFSEAVAVVACCKVAKVVAAVSQ
jgi:hypothetical protein